MAQRTEVLFIWAWALALGKYPQASPQASFHTGPLLPKSEVCIFSECPCKLPASVRLAADSRLTARGWGASTAGEGCGLAHLRCRGLADADVPSAEGEKGELEGRSGGLAQCSP